MKNRILIIDDTIPLLEEITDILKMEEYEVETASDAYEGMRKVATTSPDLIITDVLMPEINGFQFIEKIKSLDKHKHIPIIVLSAQASKENLDKAKEVKADLYLKKPCSADELIYSIESLLNKNI
ncbi:response regulator [Fulvivirga maritima]|uniref:response regulator n=1 Tax=Fulvivirga maritima TaxID=2904247 RepID=UPI001F21F6C0|nr:response regulator [Fulvivirga maritima]UII28237.1 response regulator [Fulvivirga maritima]